MGINNKKITILGGGPAGLGVAYFCEKSNFKYELFDMNSYVGGNCTTFKIDNFLFDSGAHRFHDKDKQVTSLVKNIMGEELREINVPSQIYLDSQVIDFPLSPISLLKFMGCYNFVKESIKLLFMKIKYLYKPIKSFRDYALYRYGEDVSSLFLFGYSEKLWGADPSNLSVNIAGKRLNGLSIVSLLLELFNFQKIKVKHLDGSFYYPDYGIGSLFQTMYSKCNKEKIYLNNQVTKIFHSGKNIHSIEINSNKIICVDELVSSLPLDLFVNLLHPKPPEEILDLAKSIRYRNLVLIIFMIDKEKINDNASMYFPSNEYKFTRIYEPRNRSSKMSPNGKTSLVVEIPCDKKDRIWTSFTNRDLSREIKQQLIDLGFFKNSELLKIEIKKVCNAYPILDTTYKIKIEPIKSYLSNFNNLLINGRNGTYRYTHIHDHLSDSIKIVDSYK